MTVTTNPSPTQLADRLPSPLGDLLAVVDPRGRLLRLDFVTSRGRPRDEAELERAVAAEGGRLAWRPAALRRVAGELAEYFAGERRRFSVIPAPRGTAFQAEVWRELRRIPFGTTTSYGELARQLGRPGAARAVGRANATNPVAIVVPCHRVVGRAGDLTGYAGGTHRKRALLELEGALQGCPRPRGEAGRLHAPAVLPT